MKKLFLFLAFFGCIAFSANAQKKACSSSKTSCSKTAMKSCGGIKATSANGKAAAKLASMTEGIETKVCEDTGKVCYVKNYVCSETGKMTSAPVEYDASTQKFVNVSPQSAEQGVGGQNAKAEVKTVKAVKTAKATKKKACCASKAGKSSCTKGAKVEN